MWQILSRVLMWGFIVGMAWYAALQYRQDKPSAAQESAMWDAARHYQQQKARLPAPADQASVPEMEPQKTD